MQMPRRSYKLEEVPKKTLVQPMTSSKGRDSILPKIGAIAAKTKTHNLRTHHRRSFRKPNVSLYVTEAGVVAEENVAGAMNE